MTSAVTRSPEVIDYEKNIQQIALFQKYGPLGIKVVGKDFVARSWLDRLRVYTCLFFSILFNRVSLDLTATIQLAKSKVQAINAIHKDITDKSPAMKLYFDSARVMHLWNRAQGLPTGCTGGLQGWLLRASRINWKEIYQKDLVINYSGTVLTQCDLLPSDKASCFYANEQKLPIGISPANPAMPLTDTIEWLEQHQKEIQELIKQHGAVLLRGYPVKAPQDFAAVVKAALGRDPITYRGGEGSRIKVAEGVYTSTEAPPGFHIPLHHELSCTTEAPANICFFCEIAPAPGTGQTILGSTEKITKAIKKNPALWKLFENRMIKYTSRHPPRGNIFARINKTHKTWQNVFETEDKNQAARICRKKKFSYRWNGEWIEVIRRAPGTIEDPDKPGQPHWFNQAHLYHANPRLRGGWFTHILASVLYCRPSTRMYDVEFDDGKSIPRSAMYQIYDILEQETVKFDWQQGDVLLIDNKSSTGATHGKAPHSGARRILTAMVA